MVARSPAFETLPRSAEDPDEIHLRTQVREPIPSSEEVAGIILHEIANISMGLMGSQDEKVAAVYDRLMGTLDGLKLLFDPPKQLTFEDRNLRNFLFRVAELFEGTITIDTNRADERVIFCTSLTVPILHNLIRNGVKYCGRNGRVVIRASSPDGYLQIHVHNLGVPMSPEVAKVLFQHRVEKHNGMGLGLLICYKCAARMGGSIKVRSHNGGTSFRVRIPLCKADALDSQVA